MKVTRGTQGLEAHRILREDWAKNGLEGHSVLRRAWARAYRRGDVRFDHDGYRIPDTGYRIPSCENIWIERNTQLMLSKFK